MANNTPSQDMDLALATYVNAAFSYLANASTGYYDPVTHLPISPAALPVPTDYLLYHTVRTILLTAPQDFTFNRVPSNAERKAMWNTIVTRLQDDSTYLTTLITNLNSFIATLP